MEHKIYKVQELEIVGPFTLSLSFDDGSEQTIDFSPILYGQLFGPLRDEGEFGKVVIDPEACTIVWPNGADFDPATLHDWPKFADALAERAKRWKDNSADTHVTTGSN